MSWPQAILTMGVTVVLACLTGIVIRCIQENYKPKLWFLALFFLGVSIVVDAIIPFYVAYKALKYEKWSVGRRLVMALISIPFGYIYRIGRFHELSESNIWSVLREINNIEIGYKLAGINLVIDNKYEIELYSSELVDNTSEQVFEAMGNKLRMN